MAQPRRARSDPSIVIGSFLLGFLAGEMLLSDPAVTSRVGELPREALMGAGTAGAALVVGLGLWLQKRARSATPA